MVTALFEPNDRMAQQHEVYYLLIITCTIIVGQRDTPKARLKLPFIVPVQHRPNVERRGHPFDASLSSREVSFAVFVFCSIFMRFHMSQLSATFGICCNLAASAFVEISVQIWTTFKARSYCAVRHVKFLMCVTATRVLQHTKGCSWKVRQYKYIIIIITVIYMSWSWATCWPVPVSRI